MIINQKLNTISQKWFSLNTLDGTVLEVKIENNKINIKIMKIE